MISVTLGTSETASLKAVLFQLSGITKSRLRTGLQCLLESFASVPGGALCKIIRASVIALWSSNTRHHWRMRNQCMMFSRGYEPLCSLTCLIFPALLPFLDAVPWCLLLVGTYASPHSFPLQQRLLSADSCHLFPASLVCWHLVVGSPREGKRYCWTFKFLPKCHLGNEWLGFFLFHLTANLGRGLQQLPGQWCWSL